MNTQLEQDKIRELERIISVLAKQSKGFSLNPLLQELNMSADLKDGRIPRDVATEIIIKHLGEKA